MHDQIEQLIVSLSELLIKNLFISLLPFVFLSVSFVELANREDPLVHDWEIFEMEVVIVENFVFRNFIDWAFHWVKHVTF